MSQTHLPAWAIAPLRVLVATITPAPSHEPSARPTVEAIVRFIDGYSTRLPHGLRQLLPFGLAIFDVLAIFWCGRRFSRVDDAESARRYVQAWASSPFRSAREMLKGLSGLALLAFYSDPRVASRLGYRPTEWVAEVKARRLARHGDEIRAWEETRDG